MTRPYLTRHGVGPLPGESKNLLADICMPIMDQTNQLNPWQGAFRLAPAHPSLTYNGIISDLSNRPASAVAVEPYLGISCLDQLQNNRTADPWYNFKDLPVVLEGYGPERAHTQFSPDWRRAA
jgi:adenylosuccinate synthase